MQDNRTGEMKQLEVEEPAKKLWDGLGDFNTFLASKMRDKKFIRQAGIDAGIPAESQGLIFRVGEIVQMRGIDWEVRGFEGGLLHLQGKPKI